MADDGIRSDMRADGCGRAIGRGIVDIGLSRSE